MTDSLLLSPGPVQVPERARQAMARALIHHRTPAFKELFLEVQQGLQWVFQTENPLLTLTCSGTGAFEAAMINFSRRGDTVLAIGGGKFGERWSGVGRAYGLNVVDVPVVWGNAVDLDLLGDLLEQHPEASMVTVSLSETSTGVLHPIEQLVEVVRSRSEAILLVDGITAVGVHDIPMDELDIDVMVSGSQKAFGIPPGLAFLAAGDRAWERAKNSDHPRYYFDLLRERKKQMQDGQTAFTPAISLIVALREVLEMMQEEGLEQVFARHASLARATRAAVIALGMTLLPDRPSNGLTAALVPDGVHAPDVCKTIRDVYGVTIAGGQEQLKPRLIRIGHMGFVTRHDVMMGLSALELALADCGHAVTPGVAVAAAQQSFAKQA